MRLSALGLLAVVLFVCVSLGRAQITCPDGFTQCAGMCYRAMYKICFIGKQPTPTTSAEIDCMLAVVGSSLPVNTYYYNYITSFSHEGYGIPVPDTAAPTSLIGSPGIEGEGFCVHVDPTQKKLVSADCQAKTNAVCQANPL